MSGVDLDEESLPSTGNISHALTCDAHAERRRKGGNAFYCIPLLPVCAARFGFDESTIRRLPNLEVLNN